MCVWPITHLQVLYSTLILSQSLFSTLIRKIWYRQKKSRNFWAWKKNGMFTSIQFVITYLLTMNYWYKNLKKCSLRDLKNWEESGERVINYLTEIHLNKSHALCTYCSADMYTDLNGLFRCQKTRRTLGNRSTRFRIKCNNSMSINMYFTWNYYFILEF